MEAIKQWVFSVCAAMVACGLMQTLLPKSNMEKIFSLTVSVFFLCCLLSPLLLRAPQLRIEVEEYSAQDMQQRLERLGKIVEMQTQGTIRQNLYEIIEEKLSEMGIKHHGVTINITTNGQNAGQPESASILLEKQWESRHEKLQRELESMLGLAVHLAYD